MARFDAAASPGNAIERGFYVERPGRSVADEIAARIELRPASTHLLVGSVGSGKTTQLLVAKRRLDKLRELSTIYVDVSTRLDLQQIASGALIALAGIELSGAPNLQPTEAILFAQGFFHKLAHGYIRDDSDDHEAAEEAYWADRHQRGVLVQDEPLKTLGSESPLLPYAAKQLAVIQEALAQQSLQPILVFDSLDRLSDPARFDAIVSNELPVLRNLGIGVVLVGPPRSLYGADRSIVDRFDYFYYQPAVDIQNDATGSSFLFRVLRARADADILPDAPCRRLAEYSGGVLRDLITLAQAAGEEAYLDGADQITEEHVEIAADAFGRKHLLGLGPDELEVLQRVRTKGIFVQTSDKDLALLVTRRVLEYQNGRTRYAVHPTIRPLLEQLAEKP